MEFPIQLGNGVTILAAKNPVWGDKNNTIINCVITIEGELIGGRSDAPFTASPNDPMEHGRELFEVLKGSAGPWVRPDVTVEDLQAELDKIWPDIVLGLATPEQLDLARNLRKQITVMAA